MTPVTGQTVRQQVILVSTHLKRHREHHHKRAAEYYAELRKKLGEAPEKPPKEEPHAHHV